MLFSLIFVLTLSLSAIAAPLKTTISVEAKNDAVKAGEEVTLAVKIANNPGVNCFTFCINYDSERLELKSINTERQIVVEDEVVNVPYWSGIYVTKPDTGKVTFAAANAVKKDGIMFTVTFLVKQDAKAGETAVKVVNERLGAYEGGNTLNIAADTVDGGLKIESSTTGGNTTGGNTTGSGTTGGNTTGSNTTGGGTTGGGTTGGGTTGGGTTGGGTTGGGTTGGGTTGGGTTGGGTTGGGTTGGGTTGGGTTGGGTTGGGTTGGGTTGGGTTGGGTTGGGTTGGGTTGGGTTGGGTTGGGTTGGGTTGGGTTGGGTTGGGTTGGGTTGGGTTGGGTTGGETTSGTYAITGRVSSYNSKNETVIKLYKAGHAGEESALVKDAKIAIDTDASAKAGDPVEQVFVINGVANGEYDLVISKTAHLSYTVKGIKVDNNDVDLTAHANAAIKTITLPAGNVTGSGSEGEALINSDDLNFIWRPQNYLKKASDAGVESIADINGDGVINSDDLNIIWKPANYLKKLSDCIAQY